MHITTLIGDYTYSKPFAEVGRELRDKFKGKVELVCHFCRRGDPESHVSHQERAEK